MLGVLYRAGSLMAAARELARYKLDLVGVQEVRWDKGIVRCVSMSCFSEYIRGGCLISNLSQTHSDSPWRCKDTSPKYSFLTINLCSGPPYHITKFGNGVF